MVVDRTRYIKGDRYCAKCEQWVSQIDLKNESYIDRGGGLCHKPSNNICGRRFRTTPLNMRTWRSKIQTVYY
jgi:hypothetical protein